MDNHFIDEPARCPTLTRVRVCDPFYVAAEEHVPFHGYRLICLENALGESVLFCFDRVAVPAPCVSVMLDKLHRLVANDSSIAPDTVWYEFCTVDWMKIGPTFLPVRFDGHHPKNCGPWMPLDWVAKRHLIDAKRIESLAGPVFELFTAAGVLELADSRPSDEREQILRLAGLSSDTEIARTRDGSLFPKPRVFEPGTFVIESYIRSLKELKP